MTDAVIIGSGPNGLVAAWILAKAGWRVTVLEGASVAGGGVRSEQSTLPGYIHDHCAAFFPLAVASPWMRQMDLDVDWRRGDIETANPRSDGTATGIAQHLDATAAWLDGDHRGDGLAWIDLMGWLGRIEHDLLGALLSPLPSIRPALGLARKLRVRGGLRFAHLASMSVRDLGSLEFGGASPSQILAALALHADLSPEQLPSGVFALVLAYTAQRFGFVVPSGGASSLSGAMLAKLTDLGVDVRTGTKVTQVVVREGRAVAVEAEGLGEISVRRAVLADTGAPSLFLDLVGEQHLPGTFLSGLRRFRYGYGTFKVDWALSAPVGWTADQCRSAATVHVGDDVNDMSRAANEVIRGLLPQHPYLVLGQQSLLDPSRAPAGAATLWGYTHVPAEPRGDAEGSLNPSGSWDGIREAMADRMEARIEHLAPGFRSLILGRRLLAPPDLAATNPNLVGGEINGGTGVAHQQLLFRPVTGWSRHRTPVRGLYLASASAHPGGGVHGACGGGAATMALRDARLRKI